MSFFEKLMNVLGLGGASVVGQDGKPLSKEKQDEIANSVQFSQLLSDEQEALIKSQATDIAALKTEIANISSLAASNQKAISEVKEVFVQSHKTNADSVAKVEASVKEVAQELNKFKGTPAVQPTTEDKGISMHETKGDDKTELDFRTISNYLGFQPK